VRSPAFFPGLRRGLTVRLRPSGAKTLAPAVKPTRSRSARQGPVTSPPSRSCQRMPYHERMPELVFEVVQESDGGYCAECLTESIFTEADTWDELRRNALEATSAFFFDGPRPDRIRLRLVRDEILLVARRSLATSPARISLTSCAADGSTRGCTRSVVTSSWKPPNRLTTGSRVQFNPPRYCLAQGCPA